MTHILGGVVMLYGSMAVLLKDAMKVEADFYRLAGFTGAAVLQAISHTS